ncbi:MAG: adenylate/guanylate cyclase domain-containing protein [Candidatus Kapaibacteriota bacterium]|jgi:class 3 adenylate cyclase
MKTRLHTLQELLDNGGNSLSATEYSRLAIEVAYILAPTDSQRAHEYALEAQRHARTTNDNILELESALALAVVSAESATFDEALPRFFQISKQAEMLGEWQIQVSALRWTGVCYVRVAMFTTALEYLAKSRNLAEKYLHNVECAKTYNASGDAYFGLGEIQTALQHYREALRLLEGTDEVIERASALLSIASAHKAVRGYNQARVYFEQALSTYKHAGNTSGVCLSLRSVAEMYVEQERYDKALELLFAALDIGENIVSTIEQSHTLTALGGVYCAAGRFEKALDYLLRAEKGLGDAQSLAVLAKVYELLTKCYKSLGDTERAFSNLERFHEIREQTALQDGKRAIQYLQQGFEAEQSQKEAEIYRLRNVELAQMQRELEELLINMLPVPIAQRLRAGENFIADAFENVTVVFVDIVGFTQLSGQYSAPEIVKVLDHIFTIFDGITVKYGLEKIKTIGDAYMIASGIPYPRHDHAEASALAALEMLDAIQAISFRLSEEGFDSDISVRIGMHTGSVVAGVIGKKKFTYDLWGDTVNTASRMESHGEAGRIHISEEVVQALGKVQQMGRNSFDAERISVEGGNGFVSGIFDIEKREEMDVKGKGRMKTYFLLGKKAPNR